MFGNLCLSSESPVGLGQARPIGRLDPSIAIEHKTDRSSEEYCPIRRSVCTD
jgi:hypothetical protein